MSYGRAISSLGGCPCRSADEDDFFVSDGVGCVAHRSMNVVTLECRVSVQEIGFGSAFAQFPEDQLDWDAEAGGTTSSCASVFAAYRSAARM